MEIRYLNCFDIEKCVLTFERGNMLIESMSAFDDAKFLADAMENEQWETIPQWQFATLPMRTHFDN